MLSPRITPCLLIKNKGLVKTTGFDLPKYVGDPINAVKIFNEKEVDELIVLDIDATVKGFDPDFSMIKKLAAECRMPMCYGGGVKTLEHAKFIIGLGVEKVAISSIALKNPNIIYEISNALGSQSVVLVLDVKKSLFGKYEVYTYNGKNKSNWSLLKIVKKAESLGIGEIIVNSIDLDGAMQGYDLVLAKKVRNMVNLPLTILGGAGSLGDIRKLFRALGVIAAAAGSLFVFKGKYRAVLINYPSTSKKEQIVQEIKNTTHE